MDISHQYGYDSFKPAPKGAGTSQQMRIERSFDKYEFDPERYFAQLFGNI